AFSSGAGRTSDGNGSHASTLKSPSYTKSVSWQHYPFSCLSDRLTELLSMLTKKRTIGYKERVCVSSPWRVVLAFLLAPAPCWNMRGKN
ncbi:transposase, partial [Shigella flexneri]